MGGNFNAGSLEARYEFLGDCPAGLVAEVVTLPIGALESRVAGVNAWRSRLLQGLAPPPEWPGGTIGDALRDTIDSLGLAKYCKQQPELVDRLLADVIATLRDWVADLSGQTSELLQELIKLERSSQKSVDTADWEATLERLRQQARDQAEENFVPCSSRVSDEWSERTRHWAQIFDVFGDLGTMMGRGWDLSRGVLKHVGWLDVVKLSELIQQLPEVAEILRTLGRMRESENGEPVATQVLGEISRISEELREVAAPLVPDETTGTTRGSELARMLPSEALLLRHPRLRTLWHARRVEHALLSYLNEGVDYETVQILSAAEGWCDGETRPLERGPIVAVIDTSGSMHGTPERVAKALVLEALRTAQREQRRCFVFAYSGPGQLIESELDLSEGGLGALLEFLSMSFGGGNDETGAFARVLKRTKTEGWRKADILVVSDGEWPAPERLEAISQEAKDLGIRIHGVQIGNEGTTGLHSVCDRVHEFQSWARAGGWATGSNPEVR